MTVQFTVCFAALVLFSYSLLFIFKKWMDRKTMVMVFLLLSVYHTISIFHFFFPLISGAGDDAFRFHQKACDILASGSFEYHIGLGSRFFENYLASFYFFFTDSLLVGQVFSVIMTAFSMVFLIPICRLLGLGSYERMVIPIVFLLPAMIVFCPLTLKESHQLFFLVFSFYCFLNYVHGQQMGWLAGSLLSVLIMGHFHRGLFPYSLFLSAGYVGMAGWETYQNHRIKQKQCWLICLLLLFSSALFVVWTGRIKGENEIWAFIFNGRLVEYINLFRENALEEAMKKGGRATYGLVLDTQTGPGFIQSFLKILAFYHLAPFPWTAVGVKDFYAVFENAWRLLLLFFSIRFWLNAGANKRIYGFLLGIYLSLSVLWALGTINYGTAIRHHLLGYWIIVLLGWPSMVQLFKNIKSGLKGD